MKKLSILTKEEALTIAKTIAQVERETGVKIHVTIHPKRNIFERKKTLHHLAMKEFQHLHVGVLLYILVSDRAFQIIGAEEVHKKVGQKYWEKMTEKISNFFKNEKFCEGIVDSILEIGRELKAKG